MAAPAAPAIILGYQQALGELDLEACRKAGVEVGRRFCAGDAFLVGAGDVLFALASAGAEGWSHRDVVGAALESVAAAARGAGAEAKVVRSSVLVEQRRSAGASAMRKWGAHLVCGYVLLNGPLDVFAGPLMLAPKELASNYAPLGARAAKMREAGAFADAFVEEWARRLDVSPDAFSDAGEVREVAELASGKYARERWLTVR